VPKFPQTRKFRPRDIQSPRSSGPLERLSGWTGSQTSARARRSRATRRSERRADQSRGTISPERALVGPGIAECARTCKGKILVTKFSALVILNAREGWAERVRQARGRQGASSGLSDFSSLIGALSSSGGSSSALPRCASPWYCSSPLWLTTPPAAAPIPAAGSSTRSRS
jgi:hypothetical protein